ncbi:MAG: histone deacetylase [Tepidisphaeraceae bacterium]|jgi:acetoin utilization deacetylase AcuC-like enzyme
MLGFCTNPEFVDHLTGEHHPERPDRIRAIALAVRQAGLVDSPNPFQNFSPPFQLQPLGGEKTLEIAPVPADEGTIEWVHSRQHIERIKQVCRSGGGILDDGDTPVSERSFELALLSCGAVLSCCDAVMDGRVRRAFAAVRPPGHHAEPDRAMGFCLFGNVAVAAKYLQRRHAVHTVAIVDFDVHHGNGTQAAFEDDPSVLFISIHQHPKTCYPGTGYEWEVGEGPGRGATLNIPMDPGAGDERYVAEFQSKVLPKLDHFKPEILLISAGFDAHRDDPLAQIELSDQGFETMTRMLVEVANAHCRGRIISALEGGYDLGALGRSVVRHLDAMRD